MDSKRAAGPDISITGFFHHLPLTGQPADWEELVTPSGGVMHPEASLTFGHALTGEPVRLHCDDPAYWDQVAMTAQRAAAWLRDQAAIEQEASLRVAMAQSLVPGIGGMVGA